MDPRPGDAILYPVTPHSGITSKLVAIAEIMRDDLDRGSIQPEHRAGGKVLNHMEGELGAHPLGYFLGPSVRFGGA